LTVSPTSAALRASVSDNSFSAGSRCPAIASAALTWITVGITSLLLWLRLTWSFGCTGVPPEYCVARRAITSFAFMLLLVPEPVWKTSIGKWASWRPAATSRAARWMAKPRTLSRSPDSRLAPAAAHFT
jgi:hypothetical protein